MKSLNLIALIFAAIFVIMSFSSATGTCTDDQLIFRLYSQSNTHGELATIGGSYPVEVCYNDLFTKTYNLSDPHSCTGNNLVLRLSSPTNAHAEIPSLSNYPLNVCYGDLVCTARTNSCMGNESLIVSLSSPTNAHLALSNYYPNLICCSSANALPANNQTNSTTNTTNSTNTSQGNLFLKVLSPLQSATYSSNNILVSLDSNGTSIWFFNGTGNETYQGAVSRFFHNGTNYFAAYASNSSGSIISVNFTFSVNPRGPSGNGGGGSSRSRLNETSYIDLNRNLSYSEVSIPTGSVISLDNPHRESTQSSDDWILIILLSISILIILVILIIIILLRR